MLPGKIFQFPFDCGIDLSDFNKNQPTTPKVRRGDTQKGMGKPKLSRIMIQPRVRMEYIAPFFK